MNRFPAVHSSVFRTTKGTPYLKEPGVILVSKPDVDMSGLQEFLDGFDPELNFSDYLNDPVELPPAEKLTKVGGQLCYLSFTPGRTWNKDADLYFENIKSSGHGSVLEHANFSVICYGISRSVTHELVRHRAGMAYSQVSQRYVDGKRLRFVERPEYQADHELHEDFIEWIDASAERYARRAKRLLELQKADLTIMSAEAKTDLRKKVQQAARSCLPNETEAPIMVTGNVRSWRHVTEMRANAHAETEIRALQLRVFQCIQEVAPILFGDYTFEKLRDGTEGVGTKNRKV